MFVWTLISWLLLTSSEQSSEILPGLSSQQIHWVKYNSQLLSHVFLFSRHFEYRSHLYCRYISMILNNIKTENSSSLRQTSASPLPPIRIPLLPRILFHFYFLNLLLLWTARTQELGDKISTLLVDTSWENDPNLLQRSNTVFFIHTHNIWNSHGIHYNRICPILEHILWMY